MNLFTEPGFASGLILPPGWGFDSGASGAVVATENAPVSAANALRVQNAVNAAGMFTEVMTLSLLTQYTFSFYVKNNGGNINVYSDVRETGTFSELNWTGALAISGAWTRYSFTFTTDASHPGHVFYVAGLSGTDFDFFVDAFQLEPGGVATAYTEPGGGGGGGGGGGPTVNSGMCLLDVGA